MVSHGWGNTCDTVSTCAGSTLVFIFIALKKMEYAKNIIEDNDALFLYQLLLPRCNKPKSGMACSVNLSDKSGQTHVEMFEMSNHQFYPLSKS